MSKLETYITENEGRFLEDLKGWLRIPSISTLPEHTGDVQRAAEYAADQLKRIGFNNVEVIATQGHPLVYGEWLQAEGKPTLLAYGHYDVQPVDPIELWESPPFEPTVRDGRFYARGSADNKAELAVRLAAIRSLDVPPVTIRWIVEGEEEFASPHFEEIVRRN